MRIKKTDFIKSAVVINDYPETTDIEFAFIGRSNVGKSSLINSLTNRRNLARTSKTPGRTQLINFFDVNEDFYFYFKSNKKIYFKKSGIYTCNLFYSIFTLSKKHDKRMNILNHPSVFNQFFYTDISIYQKIILNISLHLVI